MRSLPWLIGRKASLEHEDCPRAAPRSSDKSPLFQVPWQLRGMYRPPLPPPPPPPPPSSSLQTKRTMKLELYTISHCHSPRVYGPYTISRATPSLRITMAPCPMPRTGVALLGGGVLSGSWDSKKSKPLQPSYLYQVPRL